MVPSEDDARQAKQIAELNVQWSLLFFLPFKRKNRLVSIVDSDYGNCSVFFPCDIHDLDLVGS